ncbi:hypothetical protein IJI91_00405 [Candidatus Saccharibacteria bacterium]|nr:hypothetical protein [Candidatus Saccharibacteria bacterium]
MNVYISGICGTGMGPLALMSADAGLNVYGSDLKEGAIYPELINHNITINIGPQDGKFLRKTHQAVRLDYFIYSSAITDSNVEYQIARELGIKTAKRDELSNILINKQGAKLVAIAGTHGKTTTVAMLIWGCRQLGIPASYIVGTTLPFAPSGHYDAEARYFLYEADEYDRNFLHFHPWIAGITTVTFDHPDIYRDEADYRSAFVEFESQSEKVIHASDIDKRLTLTGKAKRLDATLALEILGEIVKDSGLNISDEQIIEVLNNFPGSGRRFEKIMENVYSDYAHHPEEIAVTVEQALAEATKLGLKGVVAIYEPHQNSRQQQVLDKYKGVFDGLAKLYMLPVFLTREDESLPILTPADLIKASGFTEAEPAELDDKLLDEIKKWLNDGYLILLMSAGPADKWLRNNFISS